MVAVLSAAMQPVESACAQSRPATPRPADVTAESLRLERAALGKARSAALRRVQALPLKGETTVGAWCSRDAGRDRALRQWARAQPRYGAARVFSDRSADADIRLTPAQVEKELVRLCGMEARGSAASQDGAIVPADIAAAARRWPVIHVTGSTDAPSAGSDARPDGWEDVTPEGVQLARLAAGADAIFALVDGASELKVTAARRLGEFLDSSGEVRDAVVEAVRGAAKVRVDLGADQVATAEASIGMNEFIRILVDVHAKHYRGELFQPPDFREMALTAGRTELRGEGLAPPPASHVVGPRYETIELDAPGWATETIRATGRFAASADEPATAEQLAAGAWLDGVDRLRQTVESLKMQRDVTVETWLSYHRSLKDDVVIALAGARPVGPPRAAADGATEQDVELPLGRIWRIVRRSATVVEVDSTDAPASAPASSASSKEHG